MSKRIVFPREVLLVEVERWCRDPLCNARTRLALTKGEARAYTGFECARCERWNEDALAERDADASVCFSSASRNCQRLFSGDIEPTS